MITAAEIPGLIQAMTPDERVEFAELHRRMRPHLPPPASWRWIADNFAVQDAETGKARPFVVFPWVARVLLDLFPEGDELPYSLAIYSTIKKSGKTALNAAICAYLMFSRAPDGAELYNFANSKDQSVGRVFRAVKYAIEHNPRLLAECHGGRGVLETIIRRSNGTTLQAMAAMHANIAGASPYYSGWTELWGYEFEKELRAWSEMTPPPTIRNSIRVVDTYAGYEGESGLLNDIEDQAKRGARLHQAGFELPADYRAYALAQSAVAPELAPMLLPPGDAGTGPVHYPYALPVYTDTAARLYAFWDEGEAARRMPWQRGERGARYYEAEEKSPGMTPAQYSRLHLNKRSKRGGQFVSVTTWDALARCESWQDGDRDAIYLALDAATRDDHMALTGVRVRDGRPEACYLAEWVPTPDSRDGGRDSIDPQWAVDGIKALEIRGMNIASVAYDPYQFHAAALELSGAGIKMVEVTQGQPRLEADTLLSTLIRDARLAHDGNGAMRVAVENANALEEKGKTGDERKVRIVKGSGKVDPLVALSMALWIALEMPKQGKGQPAGVPAGTGLLGSRSRGDTGPKRYPAAAGAGARYGDGAGARMGLGGSRERGRR